MRMKIKPGMIGQQKKQVCKCLVFHLGSMYDPSYCRRFDPLFSKVQEGEKEYTLFREK